MLDKEEIVNWIVNNCNTTIWRYIWRFSIPFYRIHLCVWSSRSFVYNDSQISSRKNI